MRLPVRPRAAVAGLRIVQDHPSLALERSSLGPRTSRRLQNHSSWSGASRPVAAAAQGGSQCAPPPSRADAIARIYGESRVFGSVSDEARWASRFWMKKMLGIAFGSANINPLIAHTEDTLNGAIDAQQTPPRIPRLMCFTVMGLTRTEQQACAEGSCLGSQNRPALACTIVRTSRLSRFSPGNVTWSSKTFRISYVLSFPISPSRAWPSNYGVDFRPTG